MLTKKSVNNDPHDIKILCFESFSKYNICVHKEKSDLRFILVKSQNGHLFYVQILKNYSIYKPVFSEKSLQSIMLLFLFLFGKFDSVRFFYFCCV